MGNTFLEDIKKSKNESIKQQELEGYIAVPVGHNLFDEIEEYESNEDPLLKTEEEAIEFLGKLGYESNVYDHPKQKYSLYFVSTKLVKTGEVVTDPDGKWKDDAISGWDK